MTLWKEEHPFDCRCVQRITKRAPNGKALEITPDTTRCPLHRGGVVESPTVRLTKHARERCEEMGIATKRVKHALRNENRLLSRPDPDGYNTLVSSSAEPGLLFCVANTDPDLVVTVLYRSDTPFIRGVSTPPNLTEKP